MLLFFPKNNYILCIYLIIRDIVPSKQQGTPNNQSETEHLQNVLRLNRELMAKVEEWKRTTAMSNALEFFIANCDQLLKMETQTRNLPELPNKD